MVAWKQSGANIQVNVINSTSHPNTPWCLKGTLHAQEMYSLKKREGKGREGKGRESKARQLDHVFGRKIQMQSEMSRKMKLNNQEALTWNAEGSNEPSEQNQSDFG